MRLLRIPYPPVLALSAIVLAGLAHYIHAARQQEAIALALFGAAIILWWTSLALSQTQVAVRVASALPERPRAISKWLVASGIGLVIFAYLFSGENQFTSDGVLAWLSSIAVLLYTFWVPEKTGSAWRAWFAEKIQSAQAFSDGIRISRRTGWLIAILLVGAFTYFYHLDTVPAELVSDHAEKILDIREIINGARPVYLERHNGSEPLWSYVVAAFVALGDWSLDFYALKFVSAFFGWLSIPIVFLLAREMFDGDVALIASAFAALSKWALGVARVGLPFATTMVFISLLLWFLFRIAKYRRRNDFMIAGIVLGAGFYASESLRVAPILVIVFLIGALVMTPSVRQNGRAFFVDSFLLFALALAVLAPLIRFADDHPRLFLHHTLVRIAGEARVLRDDAWWVFAQNLGNALQMFTWRGDAGWLTTIPDAPLLDYAMGGLFILGIALALYRLVKSRESVHAFLLLGLIVLLIPSAISLANPDDNPSAVYTAGALPIVLIFVAIAMAQGMRVLADSIRSNWRWLAMCAFVVIVFAASASENYEQYFGDHAALYRKASWNASEMATAVRGFSSSIGDTGHIWVIAYPYWVDVRNIGIEMDQPNWAQVLPNADAAMGHVSDPLPKMYILNVNDQASLTRLRVIFPGGRERAYPSRTPGHDFILFYVIGIPSL